MSYSRGFSRSPLIRVSLSRPLGNPHDTDGQRAVLRAMLEVLPRAAEPDTYVELPFMWPESPARARNASKDIPPSPIVELVTRKPWLLANLYSGRIPEHEEVPDRAMP